MATRRSKSEVQTVKKEARFQVINPDNNYPLGAPTPDPFIEDSSAFSFNVWAYACVEKISSNFASVEYKAYRQDKEGKFFEYTKHPLSPLLNKPNPYMTGYNIRAITAMMLALTGNAYWGLERDGNGNVIEMWPLPPGLVRVVTTPEKFVDHYLLNVNGARIEYEPNDMIHFRTVNPNSMNYGQGSVTAAKMTLAQDYYAQHWNKYFFANSARPDAVLESDNVIPDEARARINESWRQMHSGSQRAKTAILEGGLKYKEINRTQKDMDFINLRKYNREEILAAFGVPPVIVGVFEYANYANSKEQIQLFWKHTIIPIIRSFESVLNLKSKQIFYDPLTTFQGDTSSVEALRVDEQQRATTAKLYVEIGVPPNEVIRSLDLPFEPFEGGDISRPALPGLAPTGTPNPPAAPGTPVDDPNSADPENDDAAAAKSVTKAVAPPDTRENQWKRFDQAAADIEGPFETAMRGFFKGQKARVIKSVRDHASAVISHAEGRQVRSFLGRAVNRVKEFFSKAHGDALDNVFNTDREDKALGNVAGKHIKRAYDMGGKRTAAAIHRGKSFRAKDDNGDDTGVNTNIDFNLNDPYAEHWLENKVLKLSRQANKYTKEEIDDAIVNAVHEAVSDGFNEAETIDQIVDRIDDVYQFADGTRAERIARTEVIGASNAGATEAMRQLGAEQKEWLSSRDEKVRDTHKALDGNVVGIREDFVSPSGATLNFPGDPNADASEIVNCRCSVVPYAGRD